MSLYDTRAWRAKPHGLRWRTLLRDGFTCRMCGKLGNPDASNLHVDHITQHGGDRKRFYDPRNLQTLCDGCHNSAKQSAEKGGEGKRKPTIGLDGWPMG